MDKKTSIKIQQAPNQKTDNPVGWRRGLVAGLIVAALAGAALFLMWEPEEEPVEQAPEAKPAAKTTVWSKDVPTEARSATVAQPEPEPEAEDVAAIARREKLKAMTPKERMAFLLEEAKARPIDLYPTTNRVFNTGTEQVMSWIFTTKVGNPPPPMPKLSIRDEAHMAEILVSANPAFESDDEKTRDAKEAVEYAKRELIEYIGQGGDVKEFFEFYRGQLIEAHNEWKNAQKNVMQVLREDPDMALDYITEVNAQLSEKGIKPVNVPPKYREALGLD